MGIVGGGGKSTVALGPAAFIQEGAQWVTEAVQITNIASNIVTVTNAANGRQGATGIGFTLRLTVNENVDLQLENGVTVVTVAGTTDFQTAAATSGVNQVTMVSPVHSDAGSATGNPPIPGVGIMVLRYVPEPASLLLLGTAVGGLLVLFVSCACGGDDAPSPESIEREIDHTTNLVKAARELREKYQNDPHRPTWHFLAPDGVCFPFDPQGCVFWKGKYHLFYAIQVKGKGAWGHASSVDLVHWVHHPVPLTVNAGDPETAVFAGGAFIDRNGGPTMIYHGLDIGTCIATPTDDDLIQWKKSPHNPVIRLPKKGDKDYGRYHVWDTCGWVKDGVYYSICGDKPNTLPETDGDIAFLFRSKDLVTWEYMHPFYFDCPRLILLRQGVF